jgi:hypothetical protein
VTLRGQTRRSGRTSAGAKICPGYVIDHIKPRKDGGADEPGQTGKDAKVEDRWKWAHRRLRRRGPRPARSFARHARGRRQFPAENGPPDSLAWHATISGRLHPIPCSRCLVMKEAGI